MQFFLKQGAPVFMQFHLFTWCPTMAARAVRNRSEALKLWSCAASNFSPKLWSCVSSAVKLSSCWASCLRVFGLKLWCCAASPGWSGEVVRAVRLRVFVLPIRLSPGRLDGSSLGLPLQNYASPKTHPDPKQVPIFAQQLRSSRGFLQKRNLSLKHRPIEKPQRLLQEDVLNTTQNWVCPAPDRKGWATVNIHRVPKDIGFWRVTPMNILVSAPHVIPFATAEDSGYWPMLMWVERNVHGKISESPPKWTKNTRLDGLSIKKSNKPHKNLSHMDRGLDVWSISKEKNKKRKGAKKEKGGTKRGEEKNTKHKNKKEKKKKKKKKKKNGSRIIASRFPSPRLSGAAVRASGHRFERRRGRQKKPSSSSPESPEPWRGTCDV